MFSSEILFAKSSSGFYNGVATQSARFNSGSSSYLSFTPSGNGDRRKATLSFWFKKTTNGETYPTMFCCNDSSSGHYMTITFYEDSLYFQTAPSADGLITTAKYRDTTAWYHCCWAIDTTQSTASNRVKCYINGTQITDFSTEQYPDQDSYLDICSTVAHAWGYFPDYGRYFNGYIADAYIIDGQQLTPSSFTETKEGALIPKAYEGSYGTNGVHLEFKQTGTGTASTSTIGADTSGNTHHYTSSGMDSHDSNLPDCPENNFATLNSLDLDVYNPPTEGNLRALTNGNNGTQAVNFAVSSGKWYFEVRNGSAGSGSLARMVGIMYEHSNIASTSYSDSNKFVYYSETGNKRNNSNASYGDSWQDDGDIIGVALDMDNGAIYFSKNGTWQNSATISEIQNGTTTNAAFTSLSGTFKPFVAKTGGTSTNDPHVANFGQDSTFGGEETATSNSDKNGHGRFHSTVPNNFLALCSANLSEPTFGPNSDEQADDHFNTVIYNSTGDGQNITGVGFAPDLVWIKCRSVGQGNGLFDTSRGTGKVLSSDSTSAEGSSEGVKTFGSDGYTMGTYYNQSGRTYVSWNWKANAGSTTTNDASATGVGDIDSIYQANTTGGFSIVTYSGSLSSSGVATVAHGLGAAPKVVISKDTGNTGAWIVQHPSTSSASTVLVLNTTAGQSDKSGNGTLARPTSTVFSTNYTDGLNNSSKGPFVAYCFAEVDGMSKFGKFTSNGNADGAYIYVGFKPALFVAKSLGTENWIVLDNARPGYNPTGNYLYWNLTNTEGGAGGEYVDLLSNGVKIRTTGASIGSSGTEYIYMAWAEQPFKYSNAR